MLDLALSGNRGSFELRVALALREVGIAVLFGPSGSGKTTVLRSIAGLERMHGRVRIAGMTWQDDAERTWVRPEARRTGYVFQQAALLPHLSVARNLEYALRRARGGHPDYSAVVESLGLERLLERAPASLSGGERQRVAIGRAILSNPVVLLMDEPLASLDVGAKDRILNHLVQLRTEVAIPIVYVTHSIQEATRLADAVVWIRSGRVEAFGEPGEIFSRMDLGRDLGDEAGGFVSARIERHHDDDALTELSSVWGPLFVHRLAGEAPNDVRIRIRASDVSLALEREIRSSIMNVFPADVDLVEAADDAEVLVRLVCPGRPEHRLLARVMRRSARELDLAPGKRVYARVKAVTVR